jgi:hypothetical protein
MKKNLFFAAILCIGLLAIINSCVKDTFTEQDAYNEQRKTAVQQDSLTKSQMEFEAQLAQDQALLLDSLKKVGGVINYSVAAVVASESSWLSNYFGGGKGSMGLDGATVTLAQHGRVFTATTDASGIASFMDLRIGTANVNIRKTGFTTVDYVVDLPPLTEGTSTSVNEYEYYSSDTTTLTNNIINIVRHVGTMIPVFSLTTNLSTISGLATVESDLTNDAAEVAAGVKIMGIIDVEDYNFIDTYIYQSQGFKGKSSGVFDYYGKIKQIAFGSTISTATTGADGKFALQVPSTPQGLPIRLVFDDFALDQKLLLPTLNGVPVWGPQTVRTLFGYDITATITTPSPIPGLGVSTGNVQSAFVEFSAPTGSAAAQPTTKATATAVLTNSGIVSVNIKNTGEGYTQPPLVKIDSGTIINSFQAEGTAVLTNGMITAVTITSPGTGYKPGDTPKVTFVENIQQTATALPKMGYSLATIPVSSPGSGYTGAPAVTISSNSGTGAAATAVVSGYVSVINVTNPGSGYTAKPNVTIAPSSGITATVTAADITMTTANPVHSVTVPANLNYWTNKRRGTRITTLGTGSGALTDSTTLSTAGRIDTLILTAGGIGYITAPTVTIAGGGGFGAVAHSTLIAGGAINLTLDNPGQGYTSNPTVSITAAPTGGTNATAIATREFRVTGVTLTAGGNGYASASVEFENAPGSGIYVAAPAGVVANLSMGVASIVTATSGTDYSTAPAVIIIPSNGLGTGAAATSTIAFGVKAVLVTNQGSGYEYGDYAVTLSAVAAGGTDATLGTPTFTNGKLKRIVMGYPGVGYTAAPHVMLAVATGGIIPVKEAEMTATVSGGQITGITIADAGEGYEYTSDSFYKIIIKTFATPATADAQPNPSSGQIAFIQVTDPGAGYSVVPVVEINYSNTSNADTLRNANGFGSGAVATAVVTDGRVTAISITNAGAGYYIAPSVNLSIASTVMKAMGKCLVSADGRILDVLFTGGYPYTSGYGYDTAPTLTFTPSVTGKGSGAVGVAIVENGSVKNVVITNQGSGYSGRNYPLTPQSFVVVPGADKLYTTASKSYVKDLYFGTGKRTIEQ